MFFVFFFAHLLADFVLQPLRLVRRKTQWDGLFLHAAIVLACMLLLILLDPALGALWPHILLITAIHLLIDRGKVHYGNRLPGPPIVAFLADQFAHVITLLLVLGAAGSAQQLFALDGSWLAPATLVGAALIIALFAVPIGSIVWLDPRFERTALAGMARIRSMLVGSVALMLTLVSSGMALPLLLPVAAVLIRRPGSPHPLDGPVGLSTVLGSAVMIGGLVQLLLR